MEITSGRRDGRGMTFSVVIPTRGMQPGVSTRGNQNWRLALCGNGKAFAPRHHVHLLCVASLAHLRWTHRQENRMDRWVLKLRSCQCARTGPWTRRNHRRCLAIQRGKARTGKLTTARTLSKVGNQGGGHQATPFLCAPTARQDDGRSQALAAKKGAIAPSICGCEMASLSRVLRPAR
jgi:hypothetical protein